MILVLLIVAWAVVLAPKVIRGRAARGAGSLDDFRARFSIIHQSRMRAPQSYGGAAFKASGSPRLVSLARHRVQKRRRDVLAGLLALSVGTLVIGLLPSFRSLLMLNLLFDVLLVGYVGMLLRRKNAGSYARFERPMLALQPIDD